MSKQTLALIASCYGFVAATIFMSLFEFFRKGGTRDLRAQLAIANDELNSLRGMHFDGYIEAEKLRKQLLQAGIAPTFDGADKEGERTSVEQSSARLLSPGDEVRAAVVQTRKIWGDDVPARLWSAPTKIHLALAELLECIADDMATEKAFVQMATDGKTIYRTVRDTNLQSRYDWTFALKCARAINAGAE